ncbi:rab15 effector protein [Trichomycterus rosablanca]|uniref:rab15 effector protein n=1 Tax=Trichomycterus rosablanca TaxID=2290929 RepID=UPI002F358376
MTQNKGQTKTKSRKYLWSITNTPSSVTCWSLFSECIHAATVRTCEYLHFTDLENKFYPSSATLREIFLMTYIQRSLHLNLTKMFSCTVMTQKQRLILGTDWVWALLDLPSKNPRIQIAVQVLHLSEHIEEDREKCSCMEILRTSGPEALEKTRVERMVEFCSSVGRTCFALFLFFGRKNDPGTVWGLLSNNLHEALGRCVRIDQDFVEGFFKGAKGWVTSGGMLQAVINKKDNDPLTMLVKFT